MIRALLIGACLTVTACGGAPDFSARAVAPVQQVRVIDGDTLVLDGETIRIANIDAPETGSRARCPAEQALAARATEHLRLLVDAGRLEVEPSGKDRYGRTLALVSVGDSDLGEAMIFAGVAGAWKGRRLAWCR